ncbi:MAG: serine--tRNA ligase [Clostridia bacterium]|nr:serine--tRNA ligase [Clostridia bacterium]
MLDIKRIRENPQQIKKALENRNANLSKEIDALLSLDEERRMILQKKETLRAKQNKISKEIPLKKKNGEDTADIFKQMAELKDQIKKDENDLSQIEEKIKNIILYIPNISHNSVPVGKDDSENVEVKKYGQSKQFDFEPKAHWDLGKDLGILDPETAAKVSGTRYHFYKGDGARLERAIINFFLDVHTENGYTEVLPPFLVNRTSMTGTGQLPKFEEDAYKTTDDMFLIPTAEVPVTNMHRDDILSELEKPIKYCAYSACFRAEAGSAGRDTRGLIRQHQFNKVELVEFVRPEDSYQELDNLLNEAEKVLQLLNLPYRVVALSTGDLGFSSAKTFDIEVWMPSYNRYVEISSCSNFEDFQARRANIRFKRDDKAKPELVHTLNGSGVAVGRTVAAILENFQNSDGSVTIPEVLQPFMKKTILQ